MHHDHQKATTTKTIKYSTNLYCYSMGHALHKHHLCFISVYFLMFSSLKCIGGTACIGRHAIKEGEQQPQIRLRLLAHCNKLVTQRGKLPEV